MRPSTGSVINVEIPTEIGNDPFAIAQWIGEKFNWQFIPLGKYHIKFLNLRDEL
jgi:hypothetical protein|tara:strand:- start:293 stop:454 length:162 start_codon:yes stop_codon:yes gene_type:complete